MHLGVFSGIIWVAEEEMQTLTVYHSISPPVASAVFAMYMDVKSLMPRPLSFHRLLLCILTIGLSVFLSPFYILKDFAHFEKKCGAVFYDP